MSSSLARIPASALHLRRLPLNGQIMAKRGLRPGGGPDYQGNIPFAHHTGKNALRAKFTIFFGIGFGLPFFASWWQLFKGTPNAS